MEPFTILTSRIVALPIDNIDTDQIIPARFLKTTTKTGLGDNLFADWRYDAAPDMAAPDMAAGRLKPDFVLNRPGAQGCRVLLAGDNFGCGSSREHAPWALADFGFRAVISTSFADIFRNNALKNGLLPVVVDGPTHHRLLDLVTADPAAQATIDLASQTLRLPDGAEVAFPIDPFARTCLLQGVDELGYLLDQADAIAAYEAA